MTDPAPHILRLADLPSRKPTRFTLRPDGTARKELAAGLGLVGIERLSFTGALTPKGRSDWSLEAALDARVVQPCVVTAEPVATDLSETVERIYTADLPEPEGDEVEMPADDRVEALPATLDLSAVMAEALSLSLPLYPRVPGASFGRIDHASPGTEALTDETAKPFAGLADLLKKGEDGGGRG